MQCRYMVAVKIALPNTAPDSAAARDDLLQEAAVMQQVGKHRHLVSLIGVSTRSDPWMIVVSFCEHGSLLSSLRKTSADGAPHALSTKIRMCYEVACGMQHLARQSVLHRDLAARNVLLASGYVSKVLPRRGVSPTDECVIILPAARWRPVLRAEVASVVDCVRGVCVSRALQTRHGHFRSLTSG